MTGGGFRDKASLGSTLLTSRGNYRRVCDARDVHVTASGAPSTVLPPGGRHVYDEGYGIAHDAPSSTCTCSNTATCTCSNTASSTTLPAL